MDAFGLLKVLDNLKHLKRTGWVRVGIPEPETVASHMYRMAVLAMAVKDPAPDRSKCVNMALLHDIGEAIAGDITPYCGVSNQKKFELEEKALLTIAEMVPKEVGADWVALWKEYEEGTTKEAVFVKHLDKFDMIAQAFEYEQKYGIDCDQFFASTEGFFIIEPFISWVNELRIKHQQWRSANVKL